MKNTDKTKEPLINEWAEVRKRIAELEKSETECERLNKAVQEGEEKYRALYDNAPLSYQALDENGCFMDVNHSWLNMLGYQREEVIGKSFADFLHPNLNDADMYTMCNLKYVTKMDIFWTFPLKEVLATIPMAVSIRLIAYFRTSPSASGRRRRYGKAKSV